MRARGRPAAPAPLIARARALVVVVLAATALAGCAGGGGGEVTRTRSDRRTGTAPSRAAATVTTSSSTTTTTTVAPAPAVDRSYAVGVREETHVDRSRPTSPFGAYPGAPDRTFPVTFWYPATGDPAAPPTVDAPAARQGGPYPLIVFAHGFAVTPRFYEELLVRWAASGYVVAAPTYPLLSGEPAGPDHADYAMVFADTTFVLTQVLRATGSGPGAHPLAGLVDPDRVGIAGHSDGEVTAYGLGFLVCCRDPRVKSVIAMAGILGNINNPVQRDNGVPILHVIGTADEYQSYGEALAWSRTGLTAPRWIVTLVGADHAPPYRRPDSPWFPGVVAITTAFFDGTLKSRPDLLARIDETVAADSGRFRLER